MGVLVRNLGPLETQVVGRAVCFAGMLLGGALSCGRGPELPFDDAGLDASTCDPATPGCTAAVTLRRAADILFVIDNSASMGEEQGTLARNFSAFVDVLEQEGQGASYRIGVITTDSPSLRVTSCRERLFDFIWDGELAGQPAYFDEQTAGCLEQCTLDEFSLEPTMLDGDPDTLQEHPWLENSPEGDNLPAGVSMAEAFECIGPQGIQGEGFEAPLEMLRTFLAEDESGFLREDALLAVIFVTDEIDCSMPREHFEAIKYGDPISLPLRTVASRVTSGVCWRAATACAGGPEVFDDCRAVDRDFSARQTNPDDAVLYPVERYIDLMREISNRKQQSGTGTVLVSVIAGVPEDYPDGGEIVYRRSLDETFNEEYGIGPGCGYGTESLHELPGLPPVRLLEFAQAFATDKRNLYSVCADDYSVALGDIATAIGRLGLRACVPGCVRDIDPAIAGLQPACRVRESRPDRDPVAVEPCAVTDNGWFFTSEDQDVCYRMLTDIESSTRPLHDDMTPQCITRGANLEVLIERREGSSLDDRSTFHVDCDATPGERDGACHD